MGPLIFSQVGSTVGPISDSSPTAHSTVKKLQDTLTQPQLAEVASPVLNHHGDLIRILEDPDQKTRESNLQSLGGAHFRNQVDWQKLLEGITDHVDRSSYLKGIIEEWSKTDPVAALNYLVNSSLSTRCELVPVAIAQWAKKDPQAASKWILDSTTGEVRAVATESLYRTWALNSPELAAKSSLSFSDVTVRERALVGVLQEWSANDLRAVEKWTSSLPDGPIRSTAMRAVAEEMARRNPLEAIRWANAEMSASTTSNETIISTVASIAGMDEPQAIMDWLISLPQNPDVTSSLAGVVSYMTEADSQFPDQGFHQLPAHVKKIAASSIVSTLGVTNPVRGQQWIKKQPLELQPILYEDFTRALSSVNPGAAEVLVNSLPNGVNREAARQGLGGGD